MKKFLGIFIAVVVVVVVLFVWFRYYKAYAIGVKAGTLNYVVLKGYIWKTYEGELIQAGLQSKTPGALMSNEFSFSISNADVAKKLELASGHDVQLHYNEYLGALPWRGYTKFIVDSIISISPGKSATGLVP